MHRVELACKDEVKPRHPTLAWWDPVSEIHVQCSGNLERNVGPHSTRMMVDGCSQKLRSVKLPPACGTQTLKP